MRFAVSSFVAELTKIAVDNDTVDVSNGGWGQKVLVKETPAIKANNFFGLPLVPTRRNVRRFDVGSDAQADRSQQSAAGDSTANLATTASAMSPQIGPGGV
jgi:hypothetical protein